MKELNKANNSDLIEAFIENDFAFEVFSQLSKEFSKIGVLIEFSDEELSSFDAFQKRLSDELELVMRSSSHRIDQLLYVSDLSENQVRQVFDSHSNPVNQLAEMLLKRIAQKVHFRRQYRKGLI